MVKEQFVPIPIDTTWDEARQLRAHRTNSLGMLYYFIKVPLRRTKLTDDLHLPLCLFFERDEIEDLVEWPRDHYKTTMGPEGLNMWSALPFTTEDEDQFLKLGYSDDYIRWMQRAHNPNTRNLVVSENITNAAKIGTRIRYHYESNALYRSLFPETLPDSSCTWTNYSLQIKRPGGGAGHGEGTFDFIGVGGALQSRHYNGFIFEDDLVGRKAIESPSIMEKTIEFHRLIEPLFEHNDADFSGKRLVIGNRWGWQDLNSHIREHEPSFKVTMHSALGGCCMMHPPDTPILPSVFSFEKLVKLRSKLGQYQFSCQYLNNPCAPEDSEFKERDVCFFKIEKDAAGEEWIIPEVVNGVVRQKIRVAGLAKCIVTDPNHSGQSGSGRCRHAIVVVGLDSAGNFYLLDSWAQGCSYPAYFQQLYYMALKWKLHKVGFETVAAQKFAAYHLKELNRTQPWKLTIVECKGEVTNPDGTVSKKKKWRIYNIIAPILESGRFWMLKGANGEIKHQDFLGELTTFTMNEGGGRYVDQLDAWAYVPMVLKTPLSSADEMIRKFRFQQKMNEVRKPYILMS